MNNKSTHELFTNIEAPRNTRERILFVATDLFYTYGFNAVGLDRILLEADLTKTTFYNHFESKDELVVETIRLRDQWERDAFSRAIQEKAGYAPRAMLIAIFDVLHEWFTGEDYRGCLFLMAVNDYPLDTHPAHKEGAEHYLITEQTIMKMAEAAGIENAAEFSKQWSLLITGAVSQQLINPDGRSAITAKAIAESLLEKHIGSES